MKTMKKIALLCLALVMILSLCACQSNGQRKAALLGSYSIIMPDSEEQIRVLLDSIEAYEQEIALVDMESLTYTKVLTFKEDDTYAYAQDPEGTKACVKAFYETYFQALYNGRTTLNEVYETTFDAYTQEQFYQYYADLYNIADFDTLLTTFVNNAYNYSTLSEPFESGTYRVNMDRIYLKPTGASEEAYVTYSLTEDGTLSLQFSDCAEVYKKMV